MLYFGAKIDNQLQEWFHGEFMEELREKYGEDMQIAALIVGQVPWLNKSEFRIQHTLISDDSKKVIGSEGLRENVYHKLKFVLRTGLPSSYARQRPDLVEPGDFPWAGAGTHKGYTGGVSGLNEESDWWVFERIINKLIELRAEAAEAAIAASKNRVEGWRYLKGEGRPPEPKKAINS